MNNAFATRLSFDDTQNATPEQRNQYIFSGNGRGLHWDDLDEDISVEHLLMGNRDTTRERAVSR